MKGSKRLVLLFSLIVFIINVTAAFIPGIVVMIGYHNGVFSRLGPVLPLFLVCIISIVIGSLVASWVGGRVLAPIVQLRELTKKVSRGEYDVIMDESIGLRSLRELAHDFNVMVVSLGRLRAYARNLPPQSRMSLKPRSLQLKGMLPLFRTRPLPGPSGMSMLI